MRSQAQVTFVYKDTAKHSHIPFTLLTLCTYNYLTTLSHSIWIKIVRNKIKKKDILIFFVCSGIAAIIQNGPRANVYARYSAQVSQLVIYLMLCCSHHNSLLFFSFFRKKVISYIYILVHLHLTHIYAYINPTSTKPDLLHTFCSITSLKRFHIEFDPSKAYFSQELLNYDVVICNLFRELLLHSDSSLSLALPFPSPHKTHSALNLFYPAEKKAK